MRQAKDRNLYAMFRATSRRRLRHSFTLFAVERKTMVLDGRKRSSHSAPHGVREAQEPYNDWPNDAGVSRLEMRVSG